MKLLIDMNLPRTWISHLAEAGIDAVHWSDIGPVGALDHQLMDFARQQKFVAFTRDLDFGELLALTNSAGPSVVQLRGGDLMPQVSGAIVVAALGTFQQQIETGALVTVSLSRARVRILPINRAS